MRKSKVLAVIVAIVAILSLALPMNVGAVDEGAKVILNGPVGSVLIPADYTAYKLYDATVSGSNYAYMPVAAITAFETAYPTLAPLQDKLEAATPDMNAINKALTAFAGTNGFNATKVVAETNGTNSVKFTDLDFGYYLIVGKTTKDGESVVNYSTILTVDELEEAPLNVKADLPTIDKFVSDIPNPGTWGKDTDVNIGDTVYFKITSKVPDMTGYTAYTFKAHDILQNYFTLADGFGKSNVTITIGGNPYTSHTVAVTNDAQGHKITIDFGSLFINQVKGQEIVITYSAMLNETAQIALDSNDNDVRLEYSNSPYTTTTNFTPYKKVKVYTFKLDFKKIDGATTAILPGAGFTLKNSKAPTVNVKFIKLADGSYRVAKPAEITAAPITLTETLMVNETTAKLNVKGLDAGTYVLEETVVPDGFNKMPNKTIVITRTGTTGAYTVKVDSATPVEGVACEIIVENNGGTVFPITGGVGTTIFYAVGLLLAVGLAITVVARKKRNVLKVK